MSEGDLPRVLKSRAFKSSIRIAIMVYLLTRRRAVFSELVEDLETTPGNLWSHIEVLREEGLVKTRYAIDSRPRIVVEITERGLEEAVRLIKSLASALSTAQQGEEKEQARA